jgi:hypothetical protein
MNKVKNRAATNMNVADCSSLSPRSEDQLHGEGKVAATQAEGDT